MPTIKALVASATNYVYTQEALYLSGGLIQKDELVEISSKDTKLVKKSDFCVAPEPPYSVENVAELIAAL